MHIAVYCDCVPSCHLNSAGYSNLDRKMGRALQPLLAMIHEVIRTRSNPYSQNQFCIERLSNHLTCVISVFTLSAVKNTDRIGHFLETIMMLSQRIGTKMRVRACVSPQRDLAP